MLGMPEQVGLVPYRVNPVFLRHSGGGRNPEIFNRLTARTGAGLRGSSFAIVKKNI